MDFKSILQKFDSKTQDPQDSMRLSSRVLLNDKKMNEKNNDLKKQPNAKVPDSNLNINNFNSKVSQNNESNMRNSIGIFNNINFNNNKSNNNKFTTKINMFESKKENNNQNNKKKEISFNRSSLTSPYMSELDKKFKNKINSKESASSNNNNNNKITKEEIKNNNDKKDNTNKNNKKEDKKPIKEKEVKIDENKEKIILNKKEIKENDNKDNLKKTEKKIDNHNSNNIKNKEIKKDKEKDSNEDKNKKLDDKINIKNKINNKGQQKEEEKDKDLFEENININEIINETRKSKLLFEKNININENIDDNTKNKNLDNNNINGEVQQENGNDNDYYDLYENIEEEDEEKDQGQEKGQNGENQHANEKQQEKKEDKNDKEVNKDNKEKNNNKKSINDDIDEMENINIDKLKNDKEKKINIINENNINNEDNNDDQFDENLDITKLIKSKENSNSDNNNFEQDKKLEEYFKQQNGFEKTFSNIELINQKESLYVEDEMNETLIKLSEKENTKKNKNEKKKIINIKNNINNAKKEILEDVKIKNKGKDNNKLNISNTNNISKSSYTKKMKDFFDYDENKEVFKNFNPEEFPTRRYDSTTIDSGKKFFKYRFIKNKIENYLKCSMVPNASTKFPFDKTLNNTFIGLNNSSIFISKSLSFRTDNLSISNMPNYDKEKEIRIYSKEFLEISEKAIFSFNLKKYKESYGYLLKNGIVYNPVEYGEFLFVDSGFDKNLLGDFLSKDHPPNDKKEVLNSYIGCIDVEYPEKKLLDVLRFLFSKVNLPKDANLILEIMNSFSVFYFNENSGNNDFKNIFGSSNYVYILISTILAVNTMLIRKDIKNMNVITKEDFIRMNKDVDINEVEKIYLELKDHPLSIMDDDYNQNIYKKLSNLVTERIKIEVNNTNDYENNNLFSRNNKSINGNLNKTNNKITENSDDNEYRPRKMTYSLSQNFQLFTKADKEILTKPIKFLKFKGKNSSHIREFLVYDNFTKLIWAKSIDPNRVKGNIHFIMISDIIGVFNGINHSETIQKYINSKKNKENEKNNFITIISNTRQIDLKADNLQSALSWFKALKSLVLKLKSKEEKKIEKQIYINTARLKNKIEMIWKDSILPKWINYGDYLLFKIHEKKNDLYNLKLIDKFNNNNLINDDKISIAKKIELISRGVENNKILSESDFFSLYNLGLPYFVRRNIWKFLIGNSCNISQVIYNAYVEQVETVNFDTIDIKYHEDVNEVFSCDYTINQMIIDIIKIKDLFLCELISKKLEQNVVMLQTYKIIRAFFFIRNDITYNKNIIPLTFIFLILGENEFNAFSNVFNLICSTNSIKYLLGDEQFIKSSVLFFNQLIKKKIPRVYKHFKKLEITTELYLIPWFEEIFTGTLNYKILLRVLDLYLLNGDYILYQVGITLIKIQEEDILNSTISEVFRVLRRLPNKYKEEFVLEYMKEYQDIKEEYFHWNKENILGAQKLLLYQDIYKEEK